MLSSPPFIVTDGPDKSSVTDGKKSDPSSTYFQYPDWLLPLTPGKLVSWLKECHQVVGLSFIEPWGRHLRPAQKMVKKYGHDDLVRAVKKASQLSKFPFTFIFVEKVINEKIQK